MKKISYLVLFISSFFITSCDTNDDGFYNNQTIDVNPGLVSFNTTSNYNVGDYLFVEANFSRYQTEIGQTQLLDIYKTTGNSEIFAFSYVIEKKLNANEWQTIFVDDSQLQIIKGDAMNGTYVYGMCKYNADNENYEYNVGFPLLSAGNYRINFGYNSTSTSKVELRSLSKPKDIKLNMNSTVANLDGSGNFYFSVN
jgi:outer membrane protease